MTEHLLLLKNVKTKNAQVKLCKTDSNLKQCIYDTLLDELREPYSFDCSSIIQFIVYGMIGKSESAL